VEGDGTRSARGEEARTSQWQEGERSEGKGVILSPRLAVEVECSDAPLVHPVSRNRVRPWNEGMPPLAVPPQLQSVGRPRNPQFSRETEVGRLHCRRRRISEMTSHGLTFLAPCVLPPFSQRATAQRNNAERTPLPRSHQKTGNSVRRRRLARKVLRFHQAAQRRRRTTKRRRPASRRSPLASSARARGSRNPTRRCIGATR